MGEDLKECNGILETTKLEKKESNLGKLILADMNAHFKRHLATEKWKKAQQTGMAKCLAKVKEMAGQNDNNLIKQIQQKNGEIDKLKEMVQQLWEKVHKTGTQTTDQLKEEFAKQQEEAQQMRSKCEKANMVNAKILYKVQQQRKGLALELEHTQKIGENLTKQLEEAQQLHNQERDELANAKGTWKISTFVLIGIAVPILAISGALLLIRCFKWRLIHNV